MAIISIVSIASIASNNLKYMKRIFSSIVFWGLSLFAVPAIAEDYPIVFDRSQDYTHASRRLNSISLNGSADGAQTHQLPTPLKVYSAIREASFSAKAGEMLTSLFGFSGTWMNGFVYLDRGQDGVFDATLNADGTIPEGSDIMAFSYAEPVLNSGEGYNSKGERVHDSNVLNPPSFVLPADLKPGFYMMRYKIDWASIDPAGRAEDGNGILRNGGAICDIALNVHKAEGSLEVVAEHGAVTTLQGEPLPESIAFGTDLTIKVAPAEGYALDMIRLRHGHELAGPEFVHGVAQYRTTEIPAYLMKDNQLTIPAALVDGDVRLEAVFVKKATTDDAPGYALAFDAEAPLSTPYAGTLTFLVDGAQQKVALNSDKAYVDLTADHCSFYAPTTMTVRVADAREGLNYYLYIDYNNDGVFTPMFTDEGLPSLSSELVSFSAHQGKNSAGEMVEGANKNLPAFQVPQLLPEGVYRMRLKADVENASPLGSSELLAQGGVVVDALLNITRTEKRLVLHTTNGNLFAPDHQALPTMVTPLGENLKLVLAAAAPGFELEGNVVVKHGHHLDQEQYNHGNKQWHLTTLAVNNGEALLPATCLNGDVEVYANFVAGADSEWELVFSDEFNGADFSQPTSEKWMRCQRYGATWNRWLSDSEEVIYEQGGDLVARAIPNPDRSTDNVPMITGGIKSYGKFGFTYGIVEGRILSNPWTGNFPAFWMMPEDQSEGWPNCGEIDIWETIDTQHRSWHTVHSNWTYNLGNTGNPTSSFNVAVDLSRYHTYRLEWDAKTLVWYVDGKEVGRYTRGNTANVKKGQWPFNKHFHLILNQSVGNGSWAAPADESHTYETRFDWVRVYQKKGMKNTKETVGIEAAEVAPAHALEVVAQKGGVAVLTANPQPVMIYNASGLKVFSGDVDGQRNIPLPSGVYIVAGHKVVVS